MADLTRDAPIRVWGKAYTDKWVLDNSVAQTIFRGHPMILDVNVDTVYVRGFVDATVVAADDIFIGIATEPATVATGDTETDNEIELLVGPTIVGFKSAVYTDADVGDPVYMSDSATLSATPDDNPELGVLIRVKDGYAFVRLDTPAICTGA